jgi:phage-related protein
MSEVVGEGIIVIKTDESGVDTASAGKRAGEGYSKGFGASLKGLAGVIGGVLVAGKALDFAKQSVAEAREAQKVGAATTSIIKATGGAANLTASQVGSLASALSKKTAVDDEQIQAGANLLLTFKNVKREGEGLNDIFGRATKAGLDLAAAGFGSVEGNALQLGKALNDPIKGISALGRAGVTFTEGQKAQIKGFVESNDLLSAQKIILGEVEHQVGGTAEATATSGEKAAVAWGNVKETVGTVLLPVLDTLANVFVSQIAPAITQVVSASSKLGPVFDVIGAAITGAFAGNGGPGGAIDSIRAALSELGPILMDVFRQALPVVVALFASLQDAAQTILPVIADLFINQILPAVSSLVSYVVANVVPILVQVGQIVATQVVPAIVAFATYIYGTLYPALIQIVVAVAERLKPVFDQLVTTFQTQVLPTVQKVIEQIRTQLVPALQPLVEKIVIVVGFLLKLAATILGFVLPPLIRFQVFLVSNLIPIIITVITYTARFTTGLINLTVGIAKAIASFAKFYASIVSQVIAAVAAVVSAIAGLPGKVLAFVGSLVSAGKDLVGGLLRGMGEAAHGVGGFIAGIASSVGSAIADAARAAINSVIDAANSAIPNSIGIPGPVPDVDLPDNPIPRLQSGTRRFGGGWANVGEVGPERVYLPAGARVLTAAQTRQADSSGGIDYAALAAVVVAAVKAMRPINLSVPTDDPEAVAMMVANRIATTA